jgi:hypothetical protein
MRLMAVAVLIQLALAFANLGCAWLLGRRLRRVAELERTLLEIRHRLRGGARLHRADLVRPPRREPRLDPTLGFRDPAR